MRIRPYRSYLCLVVMPLMIVLLASSAVRPTQAAGIADQIDFPLDPEGYGLNGGYDFLDRAHEAWHTGEDWSRDSTPCDGELGDPVYAVANGTITGAGNWGNRGGNIILIEHTLSDGSTVWSQYAHLDAIIRDSGEVLIGEQIGTMGKTGGVPCVHLHWEIRVVDLPPEFWPSGRSKRWVQQRYVDPTDFVTYSSVSDQVVVFEFSFYRGAKAAFLAPGAYNLPGALNDRASAIAIPSGWSVVAYQGINGTGASKAFTANDLDFSNDTFDDGTALDNQVTSIVINSTR